MLCFKTKFAVLVAAFLCMLSVQADIVCGTWNLKWFPSGDSEHRGTPAVEAAAFRGAAKTISAGLADADPSGRCGIILFLQELRSLAICTNLVAVIGRTNLSAVSVSAFKEPDRRLGWQQCGIVSSLPVVAASWSRWRSARRVLPPRGYAYALLDGGEDGLVACFCVHLKSNYGARTPELKRKNALKREISVEELVKTAKRIKAPDGRKVKRVIIAGDFNADAFVKDFADEQTFTLLSGAGFQNCFTGVSMPGRNTHPGTGRFASGTIDYVMHRGFREQETPRIVSGAPVSDHNAVFLRLR